MATFRDELADIDRLIHEPARLAILTALSACKSADFTFLLRLTGLTSGNLSSHLVRLEEAGPIRSNKQIIGKRPHTDVGLTQQGISVIDRHWQQLDNLRQHTRQVNLDHPEGDL